MENACGTLVATIRSKMFSHLKVKINTVLVYIYIIYIYSKKFAPKAQKCCYVHKLASTFLGVQNEPVEPGSDPAD